MMVLVLVLELLFNVFKNVFLLSNMFFLLYFFYEEKIKIYDSTLSNYPNRKHNILNDSLSLFL